MTLGNVDIRWIYFYVIPISRLDGTLLRLFSWSEHIFDFRNRKHQFGALFLWQLEVGIPRHLELSRTLSCVKACNHEVRLLFLFGFSGNMLVGSRHGILYVHFLPHAHFIFQIFPPLLLFLLCV